MSKKISIDEFLSRVPCDDWYLGHDRAIRRTAPVGWRRKGIYAVCPITSLSSRPVDTGDFRMVAKKIGLSDHDARIIASAADGHVPGHALVESVRKRLLERFRLTEADSN